MVKQTMNPYQRIIKDGQIIQEGDMDTVVKFQQLTQGINLIDKQVLDIGCNLGMMCDLATQQGAISTGFDVNRDYISQAKKLFPTLIFDCVDVEAIYGSYDIIIASAMLHYVRDLDRTFSVFSKCANQVLCDIWLNESPNEVFTRSHRGIYIPSKSAFLDIAGKYFDHIEEKGLALTPDQSVRHIFHLSNETKRKAEAVLIYGPPESGKSTLSRTYFDYLILRTDDIFIEWRASNMYLILSVSFISNLLRGSELSNYINFCSGKISDWLGPRTNRDIVIEGFDLSFDDYRQEVIKLLNGWKVTEIADYNWRDN